MEIRVLTKLGDQLAALWGLAATDPIKPSDCYELQGKIEQTILRLPGMDLSFEVHAAICDGEMRLCGRITVYQTAAHVANITTYVFDGCDRS